jgi:hypothetical protein
MMFCTPLSSAGLGGGGSSWSAAHPRNRTPLCYLNPPSASGRSDTAINAAAVKQWHKRQAACCMGSEL